MHIALILLAATAVGALVAGAVFAVAIGLAAWLELR